MLGVCWTCYFDDFPLLEHHTLAPSVSGVVECFLHALGWQVSMSADKRKEMAELFTALGVDFDLSQLPQGTFQVQNKPSRISELVTSLKGHVAFGRLTSGEASGRLQYASGYVTGRLIVGLLDPLYTHARAPALTRQLPVPLTDCMSWVALHLSEAGPKKFSRDDSRVPVLVFSDGACEGDNVERVTVGAVLLDPLTGRCEYFGFLAPEQITQVWMQDGHTQTIGQAELLPAVLARSVWCDSLDGRRALFFLDNDAARAALIKARSPSVASNSLVRSFLLCESRGPAWPWFARVPSPSNLSDDPSRLDFNQVHGFVSEL